MSQRREWERLGSRRIGRIASDLSMDPKHFFRSIVIGRQIAIPERPGWRGTLLMFKRFKVLFAETRQCGTVDFGVAANEVMDAGTKWLSCIIMPDFIRLVPLAIK